MNEENKDIQKEEPAPQTEAERKKAQKKETRQNARFALRVVLAAYLVYLGYKQISGIIRADERPEFYLLQILAGIAFVAFGLFVLWDCWKFKKARDREEREAKRAELEAKGLLNFDEPKPKGKQEWGYRPEGEDAQEAPGIFDEEETE